MAQVPVRQIARLRIQGEVKYTLTALDWPGLIPDQKNISMGQRQS